MQNLENNNNVNFLTIKQEEENEKLRKIATLVDYVQRKSTKINKTFHGLSIITNSSVLRNNSIPSHLVNPAIFFYQENLTKLDRILPEKLAEDTPEQLLMGIQFTDNMLSYNGMPIFERIEGESLPYFELFKRYRNTSAFDGGRSLFKTAKTSEFTVYELRFIFKIFHWEIRAAAYDDYKNRLDEMFISQTANQLLKDQVKTADKLAKIGMDNIERVQGEVPPDVAMKLVTFASEMKDKNIQRFSDIAKRNQEQQNNMRASGSHIHINTSVAGPNAQSNTLITDKKSEDNMERLATILNTLDTIGGIDNDNKGTINESSTIENQGDNEYSQSD